MKTKRFDGSSFLESGKTPTDKEWIDWLEKNDVIFNRMSKIKKIIGFCGIDDDYINYMANNR